MIDPETLNNSVQVPQKPIQRASYSGSEINISEGSEPEKESGVSFSVLRKSN